MHQSRRSARASPPAAIALAALVVLGAAGGGTAGAAGEPGSAAAACDRACLEGLMDRYLQAFVAHDPARVPVTRELRYVENGVTLPLGEGSWRTVSGLGSYRHYFSDPEAGQAALITVVQENGEDALLTLRLKIDARRISEAEAILTHDPRGAANYEKLGRPAAAWLAAVPPERRATREQLAATANRYLSAMQNNDGSGDYSFFADDCNRLEHGLKTTNGPRQNYGHSDDADFATMGCRAQFETGFLGFVTRIRDRRFPVIDVERQAVFAFATLDHDGTIRNIQMTDGRNFRIPTYFSASRTLQAGEAYRIVDGRIADIEMTLHEFPYGMPGAFASTTFSAPVLAAACPRSCLEGVARAVLDALVAHAPARAPLALGVRFTQNDQVLEPGDGIWGTITSAGPYELAIADPEGGSVGLVARVTEFDLPSILSLRLKVRDRKVSEIEATIIREQKAGQDELFRPTLLSEPKPVALRVVDPVLLQPVPESRRSSRERLLAVVGRYLDAVEQGRGGTLAFTDDCLRRDNGVQTTGNAALPPLAPGFAPFALGCAAQLDSGWTAYVTEVRDRRTLAVDVERGLAFVLAYLDVPGTVKSVDIRGAGRVELPAALGRPYTLVSPMVLRVEGGAIRRIEAYGLAAAYGARGAWPISVR